MMGLSLALSVMRTVMVHPRVVLALAARLLALLNLSIEGVVGETHFDLLEGSDLATFGDEPGDSVI